MYEKRRKNDAGQPHSHFSGCLPGNEFHTGGKKAAHYTARCFPAHPVYWRLLPYTRLSPGRKKGLSHQLLENHRCGSIFLLFLSRNIHFFYSVSIKRRTLINLFWKKVHFQDLLLSCQNQADCLSGNKWRPVLPAWILWWSLFMLYPIASRILWAVTFAFPRYKYRLNSISSLMFAKLPSAWILRFIRSCEP